MQKLMYVTTATFYPDSIGGAEISSTYLFIGLKKIGWEIEIICSQPEQLKRNNSQSTSNLDLFLSDANLGFTCWRGEKLIDKNDIRPWIDFLDKRLLIFKPDVVLNSGNYACKLLQYISSKGYLCINHLRCTFWMEKITTLPENIQLIANSPYTATIAKKVLNKHVKIVLPFINFQDYKARSRSRTYITFINPIPQKGLFIAIEIAKQLPQYRFLFVKGKWASIDNRQMSQYLKAASNLTNINIIEPQMDMRKVYKHTDILLMPSQGNETFGRVIIEAHINGIPVIAADTGGIKYALGTGGILIKSKDDTASYIKAIKNIKKSSAIYSKLSLQALNNSKRKEFNLRFQINNFISIVQSIIDRNYE